MSKNENILVSVLLPAYNAEKYLHEAIQSILDQTHKHFELIIINDGSTDKTEAIVHSFKDQRINYHVNEKNIGLIATLNKGITLAKGEFLMRMDADDICMPSRMEKQLALMQQHKEVGVCGCDYIEFSEGHTREVKLSADHNVIYAKMIFNSSVVHPSLMIRTSVLKSLDILFDSRYPHAEDYELWSRLICKTQFSTVNEFLFKYRLHGDQVTQKHRTAQIESANKIRRNILQNSGFRFTEEELRVHCLLGSSQLITSINDLIILEKWLRSLLAQNNELKKIESSVLAAILGKQWYDACGITTLGLKAYRFYFTSELAGLYSGSKLKLFVKCMVRKWK